MSNDAYLWNLQDAANERARQERVAREQHEAVNRAQQRTSSFSQPTTSSSYSQPTPSSARTRSQAYTAANRGQAFVASPAGTAGHNMNGVRDYRLSTPDKPKVTWSEIAAGVGLFLRNVFALIRAPFWLVFIYFRRLWRRPGLLVKDAIILAVVGLVGLRVYDVGSQPRPAWVEKEYHTPSGRLLAFVGALFTSPWHSPRS
jgi:hypothetical protein